jgi:hypothetical protein
MTESLTIIQFNLKVLMKDVYAVLREKEIEQARLMEEVAALRVVAPLLEDREETGNPLKFPRAINDVPHPVTTT